MPATNVATPEPSPAGTAFRRRTFAGTAHVEGPGLFTGRPARVTLAPAAAGSGIRFLRRDARGERAGCVQADVGHVEQRPRHTVLHGEGLVVETVEHLLAALAGAGVTDAEITVGLSGDPDAQTVELPMGDGSSGVFVRAVAQAGVSQLNSEASPLVVRQPLHVRGEHGMSLTALPGPDDALEIVYTFEASHPVGTQTFTGRVRWDDPSPSNTFHTQLADARTFIFEREAESLRAQGWGGHLTHDDLLVIGEGGPIGNAFRFPDEPVRHKVLDLLGDLALAGRRVCGRIVGHKSGHALNHELVRQLLQADERHRSASPSKVSAEVLSLRPLLQRPASEAAVDIRAIQRILPHRFPMLLVDRVLELDSDRRAVGIKNITMGDVFFLGHYPRQPIFPGVLIVEAMGQLGGLLLSRKLEHTGKIAILLSMNRVKLRQTVTPGDQMVLVAEAVRVKSRSGQVRCRAYVAEKLAAEAEIKFMLADADSD